jgi:SAM-dependent methyltransferase
MKTIKNLVAVIILMSLSTLAAAQNPASVRLDVPYVPTRPEVVNAMLKLANVTSKDVVYDLGCGDGRIVITAAAQYGATGKGIDINPERIAEAKANAQKANVSNKVQFVVGDLFKSDFSPASVVTLYLLPAVNLRLRPILLQQLKPGTRIVSHAFDMGDWKPEKTMEVDGATIYLWKVPVK